MIDCNRDPNVHSSIPRTSESIEIPGNIGLSAGDVLARRTEIFEPYHDHLRALLDERLTAGRPTILVAQHTMTDVYNGVRREMHAAVLYNRDRRFASRVLERLRRETHLVIAENEPYFVSDQTDFTIPRHGEARGLPLCRDRNPPGPGDGRSRARRSGAAVSPRPCRTPNAASLEAVR